jgi:hypothetical protein
MSLTLFGSAAMSALNLECAPQRMSTDPSEFTGSRPGPTDPSERIGSIDILRGVALFIVLIINTSTEFRVSIFEQFLPGAAPAGSSIRFPTPSSSRFIPRDLSCFRFFSGRVWRSSSSASLQTRVVSR